MGGHRLYLAFFVLVTLETMPVDPTAPVTWGDFSQFKEEFKEELMRDLGEMIASIVADSMDKWVVPDTSQKQPDTDPKANL